MAGLTLRGLIHEIVGVTSQAVNVIRTQPTTFRAFGALGVAVHIVSAGADLTYSAGIAEIAERQGLVAG